MKKIVCNLSGAAARTGKGKEKGIIKILIKQNVWGITKHVIQITYVK